MEKELDPLVIKATQSSLGKFVKRPPLTEKLLKKPPFRFLHDIVTSVLKTTGFFDGLFDEEELVSDNVKDRENKIAFLNKVICVIALTTGKTLSVKPSKIVAGQEPDKTNELLQLLAHALDRNLSSDEAVKKFKEDCKVTKPDEKRSKDSSKQSKKTSEASKLTSKSSEKLTNNKKESGTRTSNKNDVDKTNVNKTKKEKTVVKAESPPKKSLQQSKLVSSKKPSIEKKKAENNLDLKDVIVENNDTVELNNDKTTSKMDIDYKLHIQAVETPTIPATFIIDPKENHLESSTYTALDNQLNSSLSSQDFMEAENRKSDEHDQLNQDIEINAENTQLFEQNISNEICNDKVTHNNDDNEQNEIAVITKNSSNITSTTRKSDFYKNDEKVDEKVDSKLIKSPGEVKSAVRPVSVRPSSSRPGAPRPRDKHDNIIIEAENIIVGKVNIIAERSPNEEEEDASIVIVDQELSIHKTTQEEHDKLHASHDEHGHLVQQILDSQKEYSQMSGKTEIEWQFGAKKARDALDKEIEQLRFDIQALSRVANPLGKVMDHIQEDVEVMRQELNQWTKTYEETSKELFKQKAANEDSLFPLYTKVKQLSTDIEEKHEKINDLKIIIHKNAHRIDKLLANGSV